LQDSIINTCICKNKQSKLTFLYTHRNAHGLCEPLGRADSLDLMNECVSKRVALQTNGALKCAARTTYNT
jgi:hypothetical protein